VGPQDYEQYCQVDPVFYDDPGRQNDAASLYPAAHRPLPEGWQRSQDSVWVYVHPTGVTLPEQGWKIHVSGSLDDAAEIIDIVLGYCREHALSAKFLRSRETVLKANAKYAYRGSSGKLLTLYPGDKAELHRALLGLTPLLAGRRGPYILSDLRWQDSMLYVRYGAFRQMYCLSDSGETVSALRDADGVLVPDLRRPVFSVPSWVTVPDFLAEQITARDGGGRPDDFPYDIERALHFSNGGGVYKARDRRDGRTVVLREARPMAGLDNTGTDAVERLHRERDMLRRLDGLDFVPRLYDHIAVWEHEYLVEEFIDGEKLERHLFTGRHPLLGPAPDGAALAEYTAMALDFTEQLTSLLEQLHERGVVFADLHPGNVMVRNDGRLALVDFELSFDLADGTAPGMGAPGFISPAAREGVAIDQYALACMRLFLFLPLTFMIELDSGKARQLAAAAAERFGLTPDFADDIVRELEKATGGRLPVGRVERTSTASRSEWTPPHGASAREWRPVMDSLAAGIVDAATPDRTDRLFPGDPEQFRRGGADLAHGASGVLYALSVAGYPVPERHVEWLLRAARDPLATRAGLFDGLHGAAVALRQLGYPSEALDIQERARKLTEERESRGIAGADLSGGMAGAGLSLLHFGLPDEAVAIGERLESLFRSGQAPGVTRRVGLLHGGSGISLFLTRLHEHTSDERWLELAYSALSCDLAHGVLDEKGLLFKEDGRVTAYLTAGSAGVAIAARALLRHRPDDELAEAVRQMDRACAAEFFLMPGLFLGRAGVICSLATADDAGPALEAQVSRLSWHLLRHRDHAAFPGHHLYRLSTDLATGSAGILLALHAALTREGSALPLLDHHDIPLR
jgi:hypothetical protein